MRRVWSWVLGAGAALAPAGAPPLATAHPHMFFDATAQFVIGEEGAVEAIRIAFVVDELNTLYTVSELGLDADGDGALEPEEESQLAKAMALGLSDYGFFTELTNGASPAAP